MCFPNCEFYFFFYLFNYINLKLFYFFLSALTVDDEKRQYGQLISQLILKINFGDFEQQLRFYVDARATFMNLDTVIVTLVHVNKHNFLFYIIFIFF